LGDGSKFGLKLSYKVQPSPDGLAQAFILGEEFIGKDSVCMILGDNIFYGSDLDDGLQKARENAEKGIATVFGYHVNDPQRFGIVEFDKNKKAVSLEEKPQNPKSNYAVTGLYFYDNTVIGYAKNLKPSARGELEITDLNKIYLAKDKLDVITLDRGMTWLDTGTHESLAEATLFVKTIEEHQGLKIACPEEIAYNNGWITKEQLLQQAKLMEKNQYGRHLKKVAEQNI
ncbi:MAG: glucose-1-phosphate thymidylyltransferase, partial [Clostridia bacterium]|nr:glucose-1-phosphate thymidylyltransferase [Clostridia bacterium]